MFDASLPAYRRAPNCHKIDHIQGDYGLPLFGSLLSIRKDLLGFVNQRVDEFGRLSKFAMAREKGVMITHPDDLQMIMLDTEKQFSSNMGYKRSIGLFYDGALITRDFDEHRVRRRIFQSAFKNEAMRDYVDRQNPIIQRHVEAWSGAEDFRFIDAIRAVLLDIAAQVFIGIPEGHLDEAKNLNRAFYDICDHGLTALFRVNLPGFSFAKGCRGKAYLADYFRRLIVDRRQQPGSDLCSRLVMEKDDQGQFWSIEELIPHLSLLLFAAHDTTAGTLSHTLMYLAMPEHQHWQERLREESQAMDKGFLDYDDLSGMDSFSQVVNEAMRFHPAVTIIPRRTICDVEIAGAPIPANTMLFCVPAWVHNHPDYWSHPEKFDPERFADHRKEQRSHPFAFLPFGGGAHKCLGMHFAMMNAKLVLHQMLSRYRVSLAEGYQPDYRPLPMPYPTEGLPLKLAAL